MTAKEAFKKPGVLLFLGVLIGAALVWISRGLTTSNWNLYATIPSTGAVPGGARVASTNTNAPLRLSILPASHLSSMSNAEKAILARLFAQTNANGNSQTYIDQANRELQAIGSTLNIENNTPDPKNPSVFKAKCKEGENCWSLNLLIFTMCRCKSYPA